MSAAHTLGSIAGAVIVLLVLWEAFETIILPRRVSRRFRLTRAFYRATWLPWRAVGRILPPGRRRESFLSVFGPISLLALLIVWGVLFVFAFTLLEWGTGSGVDMTGRHDWVTDLYGSALTLFNLTAADDAFIGTGARVLLILEGGIGLAIFAMVIGYLPTLSQAFSRREANVSLLDARAGSPPSAGELLARQAGDESSQSLARLFEQWESWCADLLETHVSFPLLGYYRSQHINQSWIAALATILDASALVVAGTDHQSQRAARLTFAMARHTVVDLALVFGLKPHAPGADRLPAAELEKLRAALRSAGWTVSDAPEVEAKLRGLRAMYDHVNALATFLEMPLPAWQSYEGARDNWRGLT